MPKPQRSSNQKLRNSQPALATIDNCKIHQLAFDSSLQANIIFIAGTGEIIAANAAACQLLGYSEQELLTQNRSTIFKVNEACFKKMMQQREIKGQSKALVTAVTKTGGLLSCEITSAIFEDEEGAQNSIYTIVDISERVREQKDIDFQKEKIVAEDILIALAKSTARLEENNEWIKYIAKTSYDVMWDWNIATGQIYVSDSVEEVFGYKVQGNTIGYTDFINTLLPEERDRVEKKIARALASGSKNWKDTYRIRCSDGSVVATTTRASIVRDEMQQATHLIGAIQDVAKLLEQKTNKGQQTNQQDEQSEMLLSRQKILEERLEQEIRLKEKQIEEAMEDAKEAERSDIGKELHDNVNQLLGTSRLYLSMAREGGGDAEMYLNRSSEYMLTAIEEIRKLTKALTTDTIKNIGLVEAIQDMAQDTMEVDAVKIACLLDGFVEQSVSEKFKINVFRIIQEQLSNILKHAAATKVTIELLQDKTFICLSVADNGVGFDTAKKRDGIGIANINSRAGAFNGNIDFASQPGQGCVLTIVFPLQKCMVE